MLIVKKFIFNPFSENTYVVWDEKTKDTMVIDPGCSSGNEETELDNYILYNSLSLKYLVNTHGHLDHIFGNAYIKEKYDPVFMVPEKDLTLLNELVDQAQNFDMNVKSSPKPDEYLIELKTFSLGKYECKPLFTPGHTPGEYCLYFQEAKICFTGDVLFREGIGRTDLWGGDLKTLVNSIRSKLFTLPDDVTIFPGHGGESTINHEKSANPFM